MKPTIKHLFKTPAWLAEQDRLNELSAALASAQAEESSLFAQLQTPATRPTALEAASAMLSGNALPRDDGELVRQRGAVLERIDLLNRAIAEQRTRMDALSEALGAAVNAAQAERHGKAAQGIADALLALKAAMAAEAAIRDEVQAAGYRVTLPAMMLHDFDFAEQNCSAGGYLRQCSEYAQDTADRLSGALDKPAVVRLLVTTKHGNVGDKVELPGREARALVRSGAAEQVTGQVPGKATAAGEVKETVWEAAD